MVICAEEPRCRWLILMVPKIYTPSKLIEQTKKN